MEFLTEIDDLMVDIGIDLKLKKCMKTNKDDFCNYSTDRKFILNKKRIYMVGFMRLSTKEKSIIVYLLLGVKGSLLVEDEDVLIKERFVLED